MLWALIVDGKAPPFYRSNKGSILGCNAVGVCEYLPEGKKALIVEKDEEDATLLHQCSWRSEMPVLSKPIT